MAEGKSFMVPSLMVVDIKHNATNQVPALLSKCELGHKVREIRECSNMGGDGFPYRNQLAHSMVADQIAFLLQD